MKLRTRNSTVLIAAALAVIFVAEITARGLRPHLPQPQLWDNSFTQAKAQAASQVGQVDITIVGSSIPNAGMDIPTLVREIPWAETGYNMALPGATPRKWELWSRDVVLPTLSPKLVLVGISPRDTNDCLLHTPVAVDLYANAVGRAELLTPNAAPNRLRVWIRHKAALYALRTRLREPANLVRHLIGRSRWSAAVSLTAEGRYPSFDGKNFDLEKAKEAQRVFHTFDEYAVGPLEFGAIQRLVADATAAGTSVVLLELPYMRDALGAIIPDGATRLEEFHQLLEQTAEGLQVPLITYRDMMNCRELFADFYHPNAAGTLLLSTLTARWLADAFPKVPVANRR